MNQKTWSEQNGPTVRTLSGQVRGPVRFWSPDRKSGPNATPHPKGGVAGHGPFHIIHCKTHQMNQSQNETNPSLPEPTDEDLWLEHVARQVEADARPLFAACWLELLRRALEADEDEEP